MLSDSPNLALPGVYALIPIRATRVCRWELAVQLPFAPLSHAKLLFSLLFGLYSLSSMYGGLVQQNHHISFKFATPFEQHQGQHTYTTPPKALSQL